MLWPYGLSFFFTGYLLNMFYITVLYHRGLTHKALLLKPWLMKWLYHSGTWITGLDPKTWATMHRLHHIHSDTEKDPHSPSHQGVWGVWAGQYRSYLATMRRLLDHDEATLQIVKDIPIDVSYINRHKLSNLPYVIHTLIAVALAFGFDSLWIGFAYAAGIMSHPVQGWMVNALAHKYGKRNFETDDDSRNNLLIGWFVFGEGYQNNHHRFPNRAKFSIKFPEIDLGYFMCRIAEMTGALKIVRD
jgi:stearoyl-CoA desaturase (Delta-9 desaturase)